MELFIEYQVPSDLLAYDGAENRDVAHKIADVKRNVQAVQDMIKAAKEKELADANERAQYEIAESGFPEEDMSDLSARVRGRGKGLGKGGAKRKRRMVQDSEVAAVEFQPDPAPKQARLFEPRPQQNDEEAAIDFTQVPAAIDAKFDKLDEDGAVRPTKVEPGDVWRKKFLKSLLAKPSETSLGTDELRTEKNKAFDLLDALSKSGALALGNCQLHVVIVVTHCFDKTLMETVTRDNVNPIEQVERTQLIIASAVHAEDDVSKLVREGELARVKAMSI
jgi:hypothetical protein